MGFLKTLFEVLRRLPGLIDLVAAAISWFKTMLSNWRDKRAAEKMEKAQNEAKKSKDTSAIEDIYKNGGSP
jgi:Sec-independent protein translocase protein TatA